MNKDYEAQRLRDLSREASIKAQERYHLDPKVCPECGTLIPYKRRFGGKFCNSSCAASYNNKRRASKYSCIVCRKPVKERHNKYCSSSCQSIFQDIKVIDLWKKGDITGNTNAKTEPQLLMAIRRWVLKRADYKCEQCGWNKINITTGKIPLQVHHKDGNSYNSTSDNLEVLCPNCHSLTPTYGGSNKGSGRKNRRMVKS